MPFEAGIPSLRHFWFQLQLDARPISQQCSSSLHNIPCFSASGLSLKPWGFSHFLGEFICWVITPFEVTLTTWRKVGWWIKAPSSLLGGTVLRYFQQGSSESPWGYRDPAVHTGNQIAKERFIFLVLLSHSSNSFTPEIISQGNHLHPDPYLSFCYVGNSN